MAEPSEPDGADIDVKRVRGSELAGIFEQAQRRLKQVGIRVGEAGGSDGERHVPGKAAVTGQRPRIDPRRRTAEVSEGVGRRRIELDAAARQDQRACDEASHLDPGYIDRSPRSEDGSGWCVARGNTSHTIHRDETWAKPIDAHDRRMELRQSWEAQPFDVALPGGEVVTVRPLEPRDEPALRDWFATLSASTRYHRFHAHVGALSPEQWRYLTHVDGEDHVALVALIGVRLVGVARMIRIEGTEDAAEIAFLVADEMQRRRVGSVLRDAVLAIARRRAYRRLHAYVLPDNVAIRRLLAGSPGTYSDRGDVLELVVPA